MDGLFLLRIVWLLSLGYITYQAQDNKASIAKCKYTFIVRDKEGVTCDSASSEAAQLNTEIQQLKTTVSNLQEQLTMLSRQMTLLDGGQAGNYQARGFQADGSTGNVSGVNYVNWGQKKCPSTASAIYTGYAGKSYYEHNGGGINYQCLPNDPDWTGNESSSLETNSHIYGVEVWATSEISGVSANNYQDLSCTVCEVENRVQKLMIPGKLQCPPTWQFEYAGDLMSARTGHISPSDYICVNKDVDVLDGGQANSYSAYVNPVEVTCNAIPCPPYSYGKELSCVVCTK